MSTTKSTSQTLQNIRERRAIKHYDAHFQIPEEEVQTLLEHTILSPTSFNIQNWRIVRVKDKALREQIKDAAWGQAQITDASLLFVLCADLKAFAKDPSRYWNNAPQEVQDTLVPMIKTFYEDNEQLQRDEALRSIGIAAQTLMLSAKALGYDSCPMIGFDGKKVAQIIKLPQDHIIGMIVVVGKGTQPAWERPGQLPLSSIVSTDTFSL